MKYLKKLFAVFLVICFILPIPLTVYAQRGASAQLLFGEVKGTLGFYSYDHVYFYGFKEESDIEIALGTANKFDFTDSYPGNDIFVTAVGWNSASSQDLDLDGRTPISLSALSAVPEYQETAAEIKAFYEGIGISADTIGIILIEKNDAEALRNQTRQYVQYHHFGNNSSYGFDSLLKYSNYVTVPENEASSSRTFTYKLREPVLKLDVDKKILMDDGNYGKVKDVSVGDTVQFKLTVGNKSEIWLEDVVLEDKLFSSNISNLKIDGQSASLNSAGKLELGNMKGTIKMRSSSVGKDMIITYDYIVTDSDVCGGKILNTANASGKTPAKSYRSLEDSQNKYPYVGLPLEVVKNVAGKDDATLRLYGEAEANLEIKKSVDKKSVKHGDIVTYTIEVKNLSEFALDKVKITDKMALDSDGWVNGEYYIDKLNAGETKSVTYKYKVDKKDADKNGKIVNKATVTWDDIEKSDSETITLQSNNTGEDDKPDKKVRKAKTSDNAVSSILLIGICIISISGVVLLKRKLKS